MRAASASAKIELRSLRFRKERESDWEELESIVDRGLRRGLSSLEHDEIERLPTLYRSALASLAVARGTALDRAMVDYLESLAARAYLLVYGSRRTVRDPILAFLLERFPSEVRRLVPELGLAMLLFAAGLAVASALTLADSSWFYAFVSTEMAAGRTPTATTDALRLALYDGGGADAALTAFASFLFTHNARIGMAAFALGVLGGVPTAALLFANGLTLGAFVGLYADRGLLVPLLGWLLPHGIPEILGVLLCGAAGLALGRAVLFPGPLAVRHALVGAGRRAAVVAFGAVLLFALAGGIEGVFRQIVRDDQLRFGLALFDVLFLALWLGLCGRSARGHEALP